MDFEWEMKGLNPKFYSLDDYNYEYLVHRIRDLCPAHIKVPTALRDSHRLSHKLPQYHTLDSA